MNTACALLLCTAFVAPAMAADTALPRANAPVRDAVPAAQLETEIAGFISPMQGAGICMDGATHLVHTAQGDLRLKGANAEAARDLASVANGKERVFLRGHRVTGPECIYFSVERVTRTMRD
jgi:hypothetical protein